MFVLLVFAEGPFLHVSEFSSLVFTFLVSCPPASQESTAKSPIANSTSYMSSPFIRLGDGPLTA